MMKGNMAIVFVGSLLFSSFSVDARTWSDKLGRTFDAEFVSVDGSNAIFAMANGRRFSMTVADLSLGDQARIHRDGRTVQNEVVAASFGSQWPREVRIDGPVACKIISEDKAAGRYIYESPGYRFTSDSRITDDALRNFAVMFEATRKYAKSLPISLAGISLRGGKFDIFLFGTRQAYERAGGFPNSAGVFFRGVVLVPMESLGLKDVGTGFSLDNRRHNKVLVHELAHQLTPSPYFAQGAKGWFSEGLAEYIAITPYTWGYFSPDVHGNIVKAYVTAQGIDKAGGRAIGTEIVMPKLREFFLMRYEFFSGNHANFNYGVALLLTHYFFHMEGDGKATRITKFLQGLHSGQQGEAALSPLLGGSTYEKLESDIAAAWARQGVNIRFGK